MRLTNRYSVDEEKLRRGSKERHANESVAALRRSSAGENWNILSGSWLLAFCDNVQDIIDCSDKLMCVSTAIPYWYAVFGGGVAKSQIGGT